MMSKTNIDTGAESARSTNTGPPAYRLSPNDDGTEPTGADNAGNVVNTPPERDAPHIVETIRKLKAKLEDYHHRQAKRAGWSRRFVPTGLTPLDTALPHNGLPCGAIIELFFHDYGVGSMALAMRMASRYATGKQHSNAAEHGAGQTPPTSPETDVGRVSPAVTPTTSPRQQKNNPSPDRSGSTTHRGGKHPPSIPPSQEEKEEGWDRHRPIVLIDTTKDFYPPAAWEYGIPPDRLMVIRPRHEKEAFWATQQVLRCSGVAAVIASLQHLEEHLSRRLQLAAESSGCVGLLLRPAVQRAKSFAAIQMLVESLSVEEQQTHTQTRAAHFNPRGYPPLHTAPQPTNIPRRLPMGPGQVPSTALSEMTAPLVADDPRLCRITLLKVREGMPAEPLTVDLNHETGTCPVHPVPVDRPATKRA
jgi:hypothetical protein